MPQIFDPRFLAPAGSTGTVTSAAFGLEVDGDIYVVEFIVEAVGATPTITWKIQVSEDGANWDDAPYVDDVTDTVAVAAITTTTVGAKNIFLHKGTDRFWRFCRLVVSANTNVTYRCELRQYDAE